MLKNLPIGVSDFKEIIENQSYYIDKTMLIDELMQNDSKALLFPRPRRFGKTLNMSMLSYFFDIENAQNNKKLFESLKIRQTDSWKYFGQFPVIFLTFKDIKEASFESALERLGAMLATVVDKKFSFLLESEKLSRKEKNYLYRIIDEENRKVDLENFLANMLDFLKSYYGVPPIVLIDEYDSPILTAREYNYQSEMVAFMRNFLSVGLKDNNQLTKGIITGILRVAKEDIFSGLNNLSTHTILNFDFSDKFGLTQEEVSKLLKDAKLESYADKVAEWYNGYTFGEVHNIYNPWSLLNFVVSHREGFKPYWVNTSSNLLVGELLRRVDGATEALLIDLLEGKTVEAEIADHTVFQDLLEGESSTVLGLLLFNGYLTTTTLKGVVSLNQLCELKIPNREVRMVYEKMLKQNLNASPKVQQSELLNALLQQQPKTFEDALKRYLINAFSYFDLGKKGVLPEKVYHAFILGLMAHLSDKYYVKSNPETGLGRADLLIYPKDQNDPKAWIFEFKKKNMDEPLSLSDLAKKAYQQIQDSQYYALLLEQNRTEIMSIGVAFDGKLVECDFGIK